MTNAQVIAALQEALRADPKNGVLWIHVARLHEEDGDLAAAIAALRAAAEIAASKEEASRALVPLLRRTGQYAEALIRAETLLEKREDAALRAELEAIEAERGNAPPSGTREVAQPSRPPPAEPRPPAIAIGPGGAEQDKQDWAAQFDWGDLRVTFEEVVGLADVKRQIRLRIIAPFQNPEIYAAFRREGGGGILLYGPPGCGKTYVARATAGELGARFLSIGIHDVVDKYWGESEKYVHALFEEARKKSPAVLFFDEFDTLGGSRGGSDSRFWRSLIDQLLQEMDGLRGRNRDVLVFAATNMPWDVDAAFRRPGRFDRVLFVPPPDEAARAAMLERFSQKLPGREAIDLRALSRKTDLFTGADLRAFCERAGERALERSLTTGQVHPVTPTDFDHALRDARSTALEWLATARNYARYSNEGGQYDELTEYLKRVKRW